MKKKIIAIGLITTMVVCNSMTVWAADTWKGDNTYTIGNSGIDDGTNPVKDGNDKNNGANKPVTATVDVGNAATSYDVTISWGALSYTKSKTDITPVWNSSTGTYDVVVADGKEGDAWDSTNSGVANKIKVTNKSNVAVHATFTGNYDESDAESKNITLQSDGKIAILDTDIEASSASSNTGSLDLAASTTADGVPGEKYVDVVAKVTNVKELTATSVTLGTVTVMVN